MPAERILIVDDTPISLKFTELLLMREGYHVRTAGTSEEALDLLRGFSPDLVLSDISLPGIDGLELARRVKADPKNSGTSVIAFTASPDDRRRALDAGCDGFLSKRTDGAAMAVRIREFLDGRAIRRQTAFADDDGQPSPELEALRRAFFAEGLEQTRTFVTQLDSGIDREQLGSSIRKWAGASELLGNPEIADLARQAESVLAHRPLRAADLREPLSDLLLAFSDWQGVIDPAPAPHIAAALAGKRIAMAGFSAELADQLCADLEKVKARPLLIDVPETSAIGPGLPCDLVLVHVRPETRNADWLQREALMETREALVLVGSRKDLRALGQALYETASDYLVEPLGTEDTLTRLAAVLSRQRDRTARDRRPVPEQTPSRPLDVVVAGDDTLVATVLRTTLQNYGMCCHMADNGRDALRVIRERKPQAAVLDLMAPDMDGFETLSAIRGEHLDVAVVLLSAREQAGDVLRGFRLGADDYVAKPFHPLELVARLRRLVQR